MKETKNNFNFNIKDYFIWCRIRHLYGFFFLRFNVSAVSAPSSRLIVGQRSSSCSTTRMGRSVTKLKCSAAGSHFPLSLLFSCAHSTSRSTSPYRIPSRSFSSLSSLPRRSRHSLTLSSHFSFLLKRFMFKNTFNMVRNHVCEQSKRIVIDINKYHYATRRMNYPDNQTKDPLALKNNPFYIDPITGQQKRHLEISKLECPLSNCKKKDCDNLCAPCVSVKSVACATHGKPQTSVGTTITLDENENINGDQKPQNAVIFHKPHNTGLASEFKKGTEYLNKDKKGAERKKRIIDNEQDH